MVYNWVGVDYVHIIHMVDNMYILHVSYPIKLGGVAPQIKKIIIRPLAGGGG